MAPAQYSQTGDEINPACCIPVIMKSGLLYGIINRHRTFHGQIMKEEFNTYNSYIAKGSKLQVGKFEIAYQYSTYTIYSYDSNSSFYECGIQIVLFGDDLDEDLDDCNNVFDDDDDDDKNLSVS